MDKIEAKSGQAQIPIYYVFKWLENEDVPTLFIKPGNPWENGYAKSFIGKLRDELLNGGDF